MHELVNPDLKRYVKDSGPANAQASWALPKHPREELSHPDNVGMPADGWPMTKDDPLGFGPIAMRRQKAEDAAHDRARAACAGAAKVRSETGASGVSRLTDWPSTGSALTQAAVDKINAGLAKPAPMAEVFASDRVVEPVF